jgi:hypothetical protein
VVDFITVAAEMCLFLENVEKFSKAEFIDKLTKLLPMLYLKASLITAPDTVFDEPSEKFVSEADYNFIFQQSEQLLGSDNAYLEVFHSDMERSDTPVLAYISENLADIYQEIKDFACNYQTLDTDIMNDSLACCITAFCEHWGQKLINALRALHYLRYSDSFTEILNNNV